MAGTMGEGQRENDRPWSVIGSLGYSWYDSFYHGGPTADPFAQAAIGDGQTAIGRFAINRTLGAFKTIRFGLEMGVQNGNTARLAIPQVTLDEIGGLPPQVTIKPMLALLASVSWQPLENTPVFALIKPGIAYRRMQLNDRVTFNDLSQVGFEIQAGLGMHISDRASLSLNYQGIFDGATSYTINTTTSTGHISNIPVQNGLLLSVSYTV
jgi:opacity protein-like surface antigen